MHTIMLIMAGYIGFSWAVAALWVGTFLLKKTPREALIEARS
jgi:hypothetical protein